MLPVTVSTLKTFEALKNVPDGELQWLIDNCKTYQLQNGDSLTKKGDPLTGPHFIIKGEISLFIIQNGSKREFTTFRAGDITGYLPYSRAVTAAAHSKVIGELQLMSFPTERIRE